MNLYLLATIDTKGVIQKIYHQNYSHPVQEKDNILNHFQIPDSEHFLTKLQSIEFIEVFEAKAALNEKQLSLVCLKLNGDILTIVSEEIGDRVSKSFRNEDLRKIHHTLSNIQKSQNKESVSLYDELIRINNELLNLQRELAKKNAELNDALEKVKLLSGLIPICANCKKIRNDQGYWEQLEKFISEHSLALFTHTICPDCMKKLYPDYVSKKDLPTNDK